MKHLILMIDGVCNMCHWIVRFAYVRDPEGRLRFVNYQSKTGQTLLDDYKVPPEKFASSLLIDDGQIYFQSDCALQMLRHLRFPWPYLFVLRLVPGFLRDGVYDILDRKRYAWFGKMEVCPMPPPGLRERFLGQQAKL